MTVSWRRSAEDVEATIAGDKDEPAASTVPQLEQNLLPSRFSALQFGQTMPHLCSLERLKEALIDVATMAEPGMAEPGMAEPGMAERGKAVTAQAPHPVG